MQVAHPQHQEQRSRNGSDDERSQDSQDDEDEDDKDEEAELSGEEDAQDDFPVEAPPIPMTWLTQDSHPQARSSKDKPPAPKAKVNKTFYTTNFLPCTGS